MMSSTFVRRIALGGASLTLLLATACSQEAVPAGPPAKLAKSHLEAAMKLVIDAYPAPYQQTYDAVVARLGPPQRTEPTLVFWYASDGGCWELFLTAADKGAAAATVSEGDAKNCP